VPTPDPSWPPHILYAAEYAAAGLDAVQLGLLVIVALVAFAAVSVALRR
jgi:hypothetical protein